MATFFDSVGNTIDYLANYSQSNTYEPLECETTSSHYQTMQLMLIPASILIIIYSFTIRRKSKFLNLMGGRPGLTYPISMMTHSDRLSHAASFGVISTLIFKMVFEYRQAIEYDGTNMAYQSCISVVSMLIYGINCFPIFASVTLKNMIGYGVGTLYVWAFAITSTIVYTECDMSKSARTVYQIQTAPSYFCLLYLSLRLPYSFVLEFIRWRGDGKWQKEKIKQTFYLLCETYNGRTVRRLLVGVSKGPIQETETIDGKVKAWVTRMYKDWVYQWDDNFKYSSRILSTMWVCFIIIYMITIQSMWSATSFFQYITDLARYALDGIGWSDKANDHEVEKLARTLLKIYYYFFYALWILLLFVFTLSFVIGFLAILYSLTSYRENITALYRGDHSQIRPRTSMSNINLLIGSLRYAGYQIGYTAWAFFMQSLCLVVVVVLGLLTIVIIFLGFYDWLVETISFIAPWLVILIAIIIVQYLMARFIFLQDAASSLAIDNRRAMYIVAYFLFFYNAFVGVGSCLWRLLRSFVTGVLLISRLDQSMLPRKYELKDPGYGRYLGFLHVEEYHTHPCLLVFIDLLKLSHRETKTRLTMGPLNTLRMAANKWLTKRKKPANRVKDILASFLFVKTATSNGTGKANKVDVVNSTATGATEEVNAATDAKNASEIPPKEKDNNAPQMKRTFSHLVNQAGLKDIKMKTTTIQIDLPAKEFKPGDAWEMVKVSPQYKTYRRRQGAVFRWSLAYTLLTNPQLRYLRKGFLQKRMRDANMGITGSLTDVI